jgi:hypothetical protein
VSASVDAIAGWTILAIVIATVLVVAIFLAAAGRQLLRIGKRAAAYETLPIVAAVTRAQVDVARIQSDIEGVKPLIARLERALALIRRGPIPADVAASLAMVGAELNELREL